MDRGANAPSHSHSSHELEAGWPVAVDDGRLERDDGALIPAIVGPIPGGAPSFCPGSGFGPVRKVLAPRGLRGEKRKEPSDGRSLHAGEAVGNVLQRHDANAVQTEPEFEALGGAGDWTRDQGAGLQGQSGGTGDVPQYGRSPRSYDRFVTTSPYAGPRLFFFTDPHLSFDSRPEHRRWYPAFLSLPRNPLSASMLRRLDWRSQRNLRMALHRVARLQPSLVVCGGDATPGESEQGLASASAAVGHRRFAAVVARSTSSVSVWGNHDMGYRYSSRGHGGPSIESYQQALGLIGPPFQAVRIDRWSVLLVNSQLSSAAEATYLTPDVRQFFADVDAAQKVWLDTQLREADRVVLCDHDPIAFLRHLWPIVTAAGGETKVDLTLTGHFHLRPIGVLLSRLRPAARAARLQVIPSTWQLFGVFCGYGVVSFTPRGARLQIHSLPIAPWRGEVRRSRRAIASRVSSATNWIRPSRRQSRGATSNAEPLPVDSQVSPSDAP